MLTDKKLIERGFYKEKINDNVYFIKGWIRIEKIFCGYLVSQPYKVISTIDELNELER
jgi:hypothetical protein